MRDGPYKNLPLPRWWKAVAKACEREAERGGVARDTYVRALANDLRRETSSAFLRDIRLYAANLHRELPGLETAGCPAGNSVLERSVADCATRLMRSGIWGDALIERAFEDAIRLRAERWNRQIAQHYVVEIGAGVRPMRDALKSAYAATDVGMVARAFLNGERPPRAAPRRPVGLDDDLTAPPWS